MTAVKTDQKARQTAAHSKAEALAQAKRLAARIGSTPFTKFRGNPDLFGRLVADHDHHRALLAMIEETSGDSDDRRLLFAEMAAEMQAHAAAEEQALWSAVLRNPDTTDHGRHAVAEHKEIDDLIEELGEADMASPGWLRRFAKLKEKYLHHIQEEEQEQFVAAEKHLSPSELRQLHTVFNRRKRAEKAGTAH